METQATPLVARQSSTRKAASPAKDLWAAVRNGTPGDVDAALTALKKTNVNIDFRNSFGSTALHIAVWRNHIPIVRRLLAVGASPDIRDGESGWSSLHRALHFGHLAVAGVLIEAGANLSLEDSKGRTPVDLLSGPVKQVMDDPSNAGGMEVFSWGNGSNYQLGTGAAGIQKLPCRLDALQGLHVTAIAAAKFHSMAATADGKLYSWGFGRGGRLGFSDFDIHSGQVAVITPQLVWCGIGNHKVRIIAVAKHHSLVVTEVGEVFTWGSNREGQLGYASVDTQPTPRRVTTLRARVVAAAVANKHSVALTDAAEVFTWGCNGEGQLGYGTSNSASNHIPHVVEYLKGKNFIAISAAKYHTVVLGSEGEVYTWGYKMVMPRRVSIVRNTRKAGNMPLKFHQAERLHIVAVAAGTTHTSAVSEDGLVFYWVSSDPSLRCHQLMCLAGHQALSVAAGKYRTGIVTASGDIYAWDGEKAKVGTPPTPFRIHGVKHATHIAVGENHSLAVATIYTPRLASELSVELCPPMDSPCREREDVDDELQFDEMGIGYSPKSSSGPEVSGPPHETPSLKELCEGVISQHVVEPKNALQLLEVADSLGACNLRKHCEDLVLHNLDYLLTISPMAFAHVSPTLLAEVEKALDSMSSQPWSHRLLPTPTAVLPAVVDSEEDDGDCSLASRVRRSLSLAEAATSKGGSEGLFRQESVLDQAAAKQLRALKKKLQQIEALEVRHARGHMLDHQQLAKLETKHSIEEAILAVDSGIALKVSTLEKPKESNEDAITEISQVKEGGPRRGRSGRNKANKLAMEQSVSDDILRKSMNGYSSSGNRKSQNASMDAKKVTNISAPSVEQQLNSHSRDATSTMDPMFEKSNSKDPTSSSKGGTPTEFDDQRRVHGFVTDATANMPPHSLPLPKKKHKKGGLSMFLSGALDAASQSVSAALPEKFLAVPKIEGPAWGGAPRKSSSSSLLEIQSQQTAEASTVPGEDSGRPSWALKGHGDPLELRGLEHHESGTTTRISLSQFIRTSPPIAVTPPAKSVKVCPSMNPDSSPTPWAGTPPLNSMSSFKDIQMEQVKIKTQQKPGGTQPSPRPSHPMGLSASSSAAEKVVSEEKVNSRWYKPDTRSPSSIRCIQIEEEAMKELRRMYKNVKVVRAGDS